MKEKDFITIEEYFSQKRGSSILLSPMDWQLIEQWRKMGIPVNVICQGIDRSFEKFKKSKKKGVQINSISYCNQEVIAAWEEYKELIVGKTQESDKRNKSKQLWQQKLEKKLVSLAKNLKKSALKADKEEKKSLAHTLREAEEKLQKLRDLLSLEEINIQHCQQQLNILDMEIGKALITSTEGQDIEKVKTIAEEELKEYKKRMDPNIYKQIIDNFIRQFLQHQYGIPRINFII